jgi:MFS family permease
MGVGVSATAELTTARERPRAAAARPGVLLVAVCLGGMMVGLDGSAITIAAPSIARSVHASLGDLTVIANVYLVMLAVCILPAGRLADRVGRRAGFIAGAAGFAACSVGISLSTSVAELVVLRAGQGMFAALLQPTALALLSTGVARDRLSAMLGVWGGVNALTIGLGPVFAGFVVQGLGWPVVFLVNLPVAVVAIALVRIAIGESRVSGRAEGVRAVLGRRGLRAAAALVALSSFAVFALLFALTLYLQNVHGLSPSTAGAWLLAPTLAVVVGALAGGALTERVGPRRPVVAGMVVVAAGLVGLSRLSVDSGYWALALPALLVGLGIGVWVIPATTTIVSDPDDGEHGEAAGTASAIQQAAAQVGGVLGVAVTSAALSIYISGRLGPLLRAAHVPGHAAAMMLHSQGVVEEGRTPALGATPDHVHALAADAGHLAFAGGMRAAFLVSAALVALGLPLALRWRTGR